MKKKYEPGVRHMVREKLKPSNVVMEGDKVHCDKYCQRSNEICGPDTFESVPMP